VSPDDPGPVRLPLAKDFLRIAAWLGLRGVIGAVGVIVGLQTPGVIGMAVVVVGSAVLMYVAALVVHVLTIRLELYPDEAHAASALTRRRYRLARGPITRLHIPPRRGSFATQLGGFGVELGLGRTSGGESIDVLRFSAGSSVIMIPCTGVRLAVAPASEESLIRSLTAAASHRPADPSASRRGRGDG
jgi:hypothetical protein